MQYVLPGLTSVQLQISKAHKARLNEISGILQCVVQPRPHTLTSNWHSDGAPLYQCCFRVHEINPKKPIEALPT